MIYRDIFWAFFMTNLLGYGGGPATIPLIQNEVVQRFEWMTPTEFVDILAIANALPGPIATKLAGFIGYELGGVIGAVVALVATVLPSAIAVIVLYKFMNGFKDSPKIKRMTISVQPIIAVLLGVMAYQFFLTAFDNSGIFQLLLLVVLGYIALNTLKAHPSIVIVCAMLYGGIFLS